MSRDNYFCFSYLQLFFFLGLAKGVCPWVGRVRDERQSRVCVCLPKVSIAFNAHDIPILYFSLLFHFFSLAFSSDHILGSSSQREWWLEFLRMTKAMFGLTIPFQLLIWSDLGCASLELIDIFRTWPDPFFFHRLFLLRVSVQISMHFGYQGGFIPSAGTI